MAVDVVVKAENLEDLIEQLGNIPLSRVRVDPPLGRATEADVLEAERKHNRLCELVDGVLVEKGMGYRESLASPRTTPSRLRQAAKARLGVGADGCVRLFPGLVRSLMSHSRRGIVFPIERSRVSRSHPWCPTSQSKC